ncbi:MAG: glycosyltransferase family 9 protein [Candidatus Sumerlaeota bacterium]|nr:glycosyltransferase family 9 protein [Candidatus Sumerlaeota bacterium]
MLRFEDIKFDCALYNGYKPCRHGNECAGCPYYEPLTNDPAEKAAAGAPFLAGTAQAAATPSSRAGGGPCRILIIKTGAMGDVLRTTTLLAPLSRAYPGGHVTWVTNPSAVPLLIANPRIGELLAMGGETCRALEGREFDLLLNFEKEKEPLALAGCVRAARRIGFAPTRWNTPTVFNPESRYALLLGISNELKFRINTKTYPEIICDMACLEYRRDHYVLCLTDASGVRRREIGALIKASGAGAARVGLNTGCGAVFRTKQWTLDGWLELIGILLERAGANLLLLGGKAETELNRRILERAPGLIDTGCGNTLEQFFGIVDACDLVITSDSLAMHIAIALGKHTVAIFGSTSHVEVDLYDQGEKIVTDFPCSPCYLKECFKDPTCMMALRGFTVAGAVMRGLAAASRNPAV